MNWHATVLSPVSSDTEPTVVINFDNAKYIFNAGENTCRAFLQSRSGWKRARGIFLTQVETQRAAGLASLLMSFADATIPKLDIVGPPGLKHYLAAMRMYTYRNTMPVIPTETPYYSDLSGTPNPVYKDDNLAIYSVPIYETPHDLQEPTSNTSSAADLSMEEGSLKRKRELSPDAPSKRVATSAVDVSTPPTLEELMQDPQFSPDELTGEEAQRWRELMINAMFPASKVSKTVVAQGKCKGKTKKEKSQQKELNDIEADSAKLSQSTNNNGNNSKEPKTEIIDDYRRPALAKGFHIQLPKFVPPAGVPTSRRAVAYIALGPRVRGKFDAAKAKELKIPVGRERAKLAAGQAITFKVKDGDIEFERTVRPEEVIGPTEAPSAVIILDVPTQAHVASAISAFTESPFYSKFHSTQEEDLKEFAVRTVFHICGEGVLEDERYLEFMRGFDSRAHHIVASKEHCPDPVTFTSAGYHQLKLSHLDSEIFSVPKFNLKSKKDITTIPNLPPNTTLMKGNMRANVRPPGVPFQEQFAIESDRFHPAAVEGLVLRESTADHFTKSKAEVEAFAQTERYQKSTGGDVAIITLGTGSAIPSKYRNVSSTAIQIPGHGNILLDCGEGTWGQLVRQFGTDDSTTTNIWDFMRNLKCIYISHVHGDHHMGVVKLLSQRKLLDPPPKEPLYVVAIRAVHLYLREVQDLQDLGLFDPSGNGVVPILSPALHWKQLESYPPAGLWQIGGTESWLDLQLNRAQDMCQSLGLKSFHTVDVRHRTRCYGAIIKHQDDWSVVFSGDTMPSEGLVRAGQGATVLIHEATMADDQEEMARQKAHSTLGQALSIGQRMNAKNILLTHFSARYPKIPHRLENVKGEDKIDGEAKNSEALEEVAMIEDDDKAVVAFAFDHAAMKIDNMWKIKFYLSALEKSYQETIAEVGEEEAEDMALLEHEVNVV